jgi:hypothetical protein
VKPLVLALAWVVLLSAATPRSGLSPVGAAWASETLQPAAGAAQQPAEPGPGAPAAPWRTLQGTWSASGKRHGLPAGEGRVARVVHLSGAVVLTTSQGVSRGFRGALIGYDDGLALSVGRLAWTDERGDQVFGEFKGGTLGAGQKLTVTLTGGTGRYAGITGELSLTWQSVVAAEDETVQVRTTSLEGRYRLPGAAP